MADDKAVTTQTLENLTNTIKAESWNSCISPNLDSIRQWYREHAWIDGVGKYLKTVEDRLLENLLKRGNTREDEQFIMGQIVMLREIQQFPETINKQIAARDAVSNRPLPQGEAGY